MIPKAGDLVTMDPWYEDPFMEDHPDEFDVLNATLQVVQVSKWSPEIIEVVVSVLPTYKLRVFLLDREGRYQGFSAPAPSLFMPTLHRLSGFVAPDPDDLPQYILDDAARP